MPIACQIVKPLCIVTGLEQHTGVGLTPIGVPAPNPATMWASLGPTCITPAGDWYSSDVSGDDCGFVKRGSESAHLRPHVCLSGPPLPSVVPPVTDLGLIALHIAFGSSKTTFGPFSVKAHITAKDEAPAVMMLVPTLFAGPANHMVCCSPLDVPSPMAVQVPNSVFAGMSMGDVLGCVVLVGVDLAIGWVKGKVAEHALGGLQKAITRRLAPVIARTRPMAVRRALFVATDKGEAVLGEWVGKGLSPLVGLVGKAIPDGVAKAPEHLAEWIAEAL